VAGRGGRAGRDRRHGDEPLSRQLLASLLATVSRTTHTVVCARHHCKRYPPTLHKQLALSSARGLSETRNPAPVTSASLRRDGLHVMAVGRNDRRAVKKKPPRLIGRRSGSGGRILRLYGKVRLG
jgi:hypothetical protein